MLCTYSSIALVHKYTEKWIPISEIFQNYQTAVQFNTGVRIFPLVLKGTPTLGTINNAHTYTRIRAKHTYTHAFSIP